MCKTIDFSKSIIELLKNRSASELGNACNSFKFGSIAFFDICVLHGIPLFYLLKSIVSLKDSM